MGWGWLCLSRRQTLICGIWLTSTLLPLIGSSIVTLIVSESCFTKRFVGSMRTEASSGMKFLLRSEAGARWPARSVSIMLNLKFRAVKMMLVLISGRAMMKIIISMRKSRVTK